VAREMGRVSVEKRPHIWAHCNPVPSYPVDQATWEEEEAMSEPHKLIEEFDAAAAKEGLPDDPHATILLREAVRGGCIDPNA
jgi:hypothetical protein